MTVKFRLGGVAFPEIVRPPYRTWWATIPEKYEQLLRSKVSHLSGCNEPPFRKGLWRFVTESELGMEPWLAYRNGNTRKGYWAVAGSGILSTTITDKRLAQAGYFDILAKYESLQVDWTAVYRTVRTVVWEVGHSTNGWPPTRLQKSCGKLLKR